MSFLPIRPGAALESASREVAELPFAGGVIGIPTDVSDVALCTGLNSRQHFEVVLALCCSFLIARNHAVDQTR